MLLHVTCSFPPKILGCIVDVTRGKKKKWKKITHISNGVQSKNCILYILLMKHSKRKLARLFGVRPWRLLRTSHALKCTCLQILLPRSPRPETLCKQKEVTYKNLNNSNNTISHSISLHIPTPFNSSGPSHWLIFERVHYPPNYQMFFKECRWWKYFRLFCCERQ